MDEPDAGKEADMARRDDSNKFVVSITMFNRTTNTMPAVICALLILVGLILWYLKEADSAT